MRLRDLLWKSAQLLLALVFLLMGIYGGDLPLGLLCASLLSAAALGPGPSAASRAPSPGRALAALPCRLDRPQIRTAVRLALRAYGWLGWALAAACVVLIAVGRPIGALTTTVVSLYVGLWLLASTSALAGRLLRPRAATR